MKRIKRVAVPALLMLACGLPVNAAEKPEAATDGFSTLISARDKRDGVGRQEEPQSGPLAEQPRRVSMPAPVRSVIRAYYGPNGELRWGCSIEPRSLVNSGFNDRIHD